MTRSLESAQKQSESYDQSQIHTLKLHLFVMSVPEGTWRTKFCHRARLLSLILILRLLYPDRSDTNVSFVDSTSNQDIVAQQEILYVEIALRRVSFQKFTKLQSQHLQPLIL